MLEIVNGKFRWKISMKLLYRSEEKVIDHLHRKNLLPLQILTTKPTRLQDLRLKLSELCRCSRNFLTSILNFWIF